MGDSGSTSQSPAAHKARLKAATQSGSPPSEYIEALAEVGKQGVYGALQDNLQLLKAMMRNCSDVVYRSFTMGLPNAPMAAVVYVDGLVDKNTIDRAILSSLMIDIRMTQGLNSSQSLAQLVHDRLLPQNEVQVARTMGSLVEGVMRGKTAVLMDGECVAFLASTQGWESRGVTEPVTEGAVRGPRDGFTENLRTNTALVRLRVPSAALKLDELEIGRITQTKVVVAYLEGVVNPAIVQEVHSRLSRIRIDGVLESGYLEEFIEDSPWSPFPQIEHTERPDKTAGGLLEGRVAIFTGNTPFVLLVPTTLPQFLQATEDHYERFWHSSMIRWIRIVAWHIALLLPSVYVSVTTYQTELIPPALLFSLAAAREGVPFPGVVEAMLMEVSLEVLREAGVRLPRPVGQAVSIVGGLVIGESAVRAGIASPAMVIVVALTAIASFSNPAYNLMNAVRFLRFGMMILAASFGLPGVMWGVMAVHLHLATLRSFGVPYLSPLGPLNTSDLKDIAMRAPWWALIRRPRLTAGQARRRQPAGQAPRPPQGG